MALTNNMLERYASWVVRRSSLVLLLVAVCTVAATIGVSHLTSNPDNRVFFGPDNPQLRALENLEQTYTRTDNVFIAVAPDSGTIATPYALNIVRELTDAAWQIPYSSRVDSISNYQYTRAVGDDLDVSDLIGDEQLLSDQSARAVVQIALSKSFLVNRLISPDAAVTGVNITVLKPEGNANAVYEVNDYTKTLINDFESRYPDIKLYVTGGVPFDVAFSVLPNQEGAILIPIMFVLILLIVGLSFRTVWATVSVLLLVVLSVATAHGLAGWAGAVLNAGTIGAPIMIATLSVAHCVHILVTVSQRMADGWGQKEAVREAVRINLTPILITSATTAIGFLSLNFSDAPPFRLLGNIVAVGVLVGFILSVTLLPAILSKVRLPIVSQSILRPRFSAFAKTVVRRHKLLLWLMPAIVVLLSFGNFRITLDDNFLTYFSDKFEIRRDTNFVEERLTGLNALEWSLPAKDEGGVNDPEYLRTMDKFIQWLRTQDKVNNVVGLSQTIKELNQSMNGGDPAFNKIPESRELAAQYLLLYELSLPYGLDLNSSVDVGKSEARVVALVQGASSADIRKLAVAGDAWLAKNAGSQAIAASGLSLVFAYISERNINSMLFGSLLALILISFILIFALRNIKIGLVSLLPNLLPVVMALGLWGYLVGVAGLSIAIVAAVTLGIVVDDTVHFLNRYLRARREQGQTAEQAIVSTFETVGVALWITSFTLIVGFTVLFFSGFKVNSELGILTAVTIAFALVADFLLLPAILLVLDKLYPQADNQAMRISES